MSFSNLGPRSPFPTNCHLPFAGLPSSKLLSFQAYDTGLPTWFLPQRQHWLLGRAAKAQAPWKGFPGPPWYRYHISHSRRASHSGHESPCWSLNLLFFIPCFHLLFLLIFIFCQSKSFHKSKLHHWCLGGDNRFDPWTNVAAAPLFPLMALLLALNWCCLELYLVIFISHLIFSTSLQGGIGTPFAKEETGAQRGCSSS